MRAFQPTDKLFTLDDTMNQIDDVDKFGDSQRTGNAYTVQPGNEKRVKDRDGHTCVFSGMPDPEAAHVFPFTNHYAFYKAINVW